MRRTLSNLDLLLGEPPGSAPPPTPQQARDASPSRAAPRAARVPRVRRPDAAAQAAPGALPPAPDTPADLERFLASLKARGEAPSAGEQERARRELESLLANLGSKRGGDEASPSQPGSDLASLLGGAVVPPADVDTLRRSVFGVGTFFVTSTEASTDRPGGILFRGNVRAASRAAAFAAVTSRVASLFGDKYTVFICDPPEPPPFSDAAEELPQQPSGRDGDKEPPCSFIVQPTAAAVPQPLAGWQRGVALGLGLLTLAACAELGLEASLTQLPAETLAFLARPDAAAVLAGASDAAGGVAAAAPSLPGIEALDPSRLLSSAAPIAAGVALVTACHEAGHRVAAASRGVTLSPPFLIPNGSLGTFGAITRFASLVADRTAMVDISLAGPTAGATAAALLFLFGLAASTSLGATLPFADGADAARTAALAAGLVPVPRALFDGSFLLGGIASPLLLHTPSSATAFVHPALIAGWCGLVTSALNALPVGCTDGGRSFGAAFGRGPLAAASLGVYLSLGLGLLAGSLSLPWGLYVLIAQRSPEKAPLDGVTQPGPERRRAVGISVALALAILLPAASALSGLAGGDAGGFL